MARKPTKRRAALPKKEPAPKPKLNYQAAADAFPTSARLFGPRKTLSFAEWTRPAMPPPGVGPDGNAKLAMDGIADCSSSFSSATAWAGTMVNSAWAEGLVFPGYPYLGELAQRAEFRRLSEVLPTHATRKWMTLKNSGEEDKTAKLMELEAEMQRFNIKELFARVSTHDNLFGRAHLYIDLGEQSEAELKTSIGDGSTSLTLSKVKKGSLRGFKVIEPIHCYPTSYDSSDPLSDRWYDPDVWFVMQRQLHRTRLLKFVSREVPDIIKPAYSFGGLSLSQMAQVYVENWLRTRQSVSDLIHSFSVSGLKTDLSALLGVDGGQLKERANLFNVTRDNKGLMILQNGDAANAEEFFNITTPLSTLDELQAQAQEHMCALDGYPVLVLLGLTPHGLNPSSEGEIKSFNSRVNAYQVSFMAPHLKTVLDIVQINKYGALDPDIIFEWNSLEDMTDLEKATIEKTKADTDSVLISSGVLNPEDARARIAGDPDSDYASIEVDDLPDMGDPTGLEDDMGALGLGGEPDPRASRMRPDEPRREEGAPRRDDRGPRVREREAA